MAAPNIVSLPWLRIASALQVATPTLTAITWPTLAATTVTTDHALQLDAIFCSNFNTSSQAGWITIIHRTAGTDFVIRYQVPISAKAYLNLLLGKPKYMAEGDSIWVKASADSTIQIDIPYSDAAPS